MELLEKEIRSRYFAMTQKPLIACLKDACNRYAMVLEKERGKRKIEPDRIERSGSRISPISVSGLFFSAPAVGTELAGRNSDGFHQIVQTMELKRSEI